MSAPPHLSLVLACYNEAPHVRESFAEIRDTLEHAGWPFEVSDSVRDFLALVRFRRRLRDGTA